MRIKFYLVGWGDIIISDVSEGILSLICSYLLFLARAIVEGGPIYYRMLRMNEMNRIRQIYPFQLNKKTI